MTMLLSKNLFVLAICLTLSSVEGLSAADSDSDCPPESGGDEGVEQIWKWWAAMAEQKPVKCKDNFWSKPIPKEELMLDKREMVFQTCMEGQQQFLIDNKGRRNIFSRSKACLS